MGLAATLSVGFVGCSDDDEPTPEIVTDNPLDKEVYYIAGKVTEGGKSLEGVEVSASGKSVKTAADGTYQLAMDKVGTYVVTFAKDGYVTVTADAMIPSGTPKHGSVALSQTLTSLAASVTVSADKDAVVYDERTHVAELHIPAGAVPEDTDITMTEYVKGVKVEGDHASLSTINCTPDGLEFGKDVEVVIKNTTSNAISFADVKHFVEEGNDWKEIGTADFDADRNAYVCSLSVSNYCKIQIGKAHKAIEKSLSKLVEKGKMEAAEQEVNGKQKIGWEIEGDLKQQLSSAFSALSSSDVDKLASQLNTAITSTKGSTAGVEEIPFSLGTAKADGDQKVTIDMKAKKNLSSFSVNFNYQGRVVPFSVKVATYAGVSTTITKEGGASHPGHSGGVIQ